MTLLRDQHAQFWRDIEHDGTPGLLGPVAKQVISRHINRAIWRCRCVRRIEVKAAANQGEENSQETSRIRLSQPAIRNLGDDDVLIIDKRSLTAEFHNGLRIDLASVLENNFKPVEKSVFIDRELHNYSFHSIGEIHCMSEWKVYNIYNQVKNKLIVILNSYRYSK